MSSRDTRPAVRGTRNDGYEGVYRYDIIYESNAPQPPLKVRGGEGELWMFDRLPIAS